MTSRAENPQTGTESQTSNLFRRYQLLIEYKNLRSSNSCPTGIYIIPDPDNLYVWHGALFLHRGYYKEGVFKFHIEIPENYPEVIPAVRFITDMFHPLIDREGYFNLGQQFNTERSYFSKLAAQCAQLSSSEPILFDKDSNHLMAFTPIDDAQFEHIQSLINKSVGRKP
ncbi:hypothetical protein BASA60_001348 [Batrachochytrium salamandrivorans]|nr:hypothetical protein BASA60_001348 [Batrachochytrium salamandrivorans]